MSTEIEKAREWLDKNAEPCPCGEKHGDFRGVAMVRFNNAWAFKMRDGKILKTAELLAAYHASSTAEQPQGSAASHGYLGHENKALDSHPTAQPSEWGGYAQRDESLGAANVANPQEARLPRVAPSTHDSAAEHSAPNVSKPNVIVLTMPLLNRLLDAVHRGDKEEIVSLYYELWPEELPNEDIDGIKRGLDDVLAGRVRPLEDIERELERRTGEAPAPNKCKLCNGLGWVNGNLPQTTSVCP